MTLKEQLAECLSEMESLTAKMRELTAQIEMPKLKIFEFKIGDSCEIIGNDSDIHGDKLHHDFEIGDIVEIIKAEPDDDITTFQLCKKETLIQYVLNSHLKKL